MEENKLTTSKISPRVVGMISAIGDYDSKQVPVHVIIAPATPEYFKKFLKEKMFLINDQILSSLYEGHLSGNEIIMLEEQEWILEIKPKFNTSINDIGPIGRRIVKHG